VGRNRREARGFLAKTPSPSFPSRSRTKDRRGGARRPALEGGGTGGSSRGGGRGVEQNGEGDEGILSPCSPWTEAARGESSTGGGGPVVVVLGGGGALVLGQVKEVVVVRCGGPVSGRPLL
jgi:hypothetical protein